MLDITLCAFFSKRSHSQENMREWVSILGVVDIKVSARTFRNKLRGTSLLSDILYQRRV